MPAQCHVVLPGLPVGSNVALCVFGQAGVGMTDAFSLAMCSSGCGLAYAADGGQRQGEAEAVPAAGSLEVAFPIVRNKRQSGKKKAPAGVPLNFIALCCRALLRAPPHEFRECEFHGVLRGRLASRCFQHLDVGNHASYRGRGQRVVVRSLRAQQPLLPVTERDRGKRRSTRARQWSDSTCRAGVGQCGT